MPAKNVYPAKANSQSPIEEQLAEYRDCYNDPIKNVSIDQTKDPLITWKPVPYDPRFPNVDITKYCYVSFVDYYRCRKLRGPDYEPCDYFKNIYTGICPSFWIERWEEQRANGTFLANV